VVAADIDCRFLSGLPRNVDIRTLDIRHDELEPEGYDLIHCRALLIHLPDPVGVLRRMVAGLRPGGVLLAEESDHGHCSPMAAIRTPDGPRTSCDDSSMVS
jgi:chemotaxis methyl-accepting protein methylase